MSGAATVFVAVTAVLHVLFMFAEMYLWDKPLGLKVFRHGPEKAAHSKILAMNQGLYNGVLAAGLFWGLSLGPGGEPVIRFFLWAVAVVGVFGAVSATWRIFPIQALPALVALALL